MGRLGHSTPGAAMRYQHAAADRGAEIARRLSELAGGDAVAPRLWLMTAILRRAVLRAYTRFMSESRVVADHRIMGGVPCIRGTRIPVATIVGLVAQGRSVDEIVADYSQLSPADVRAALEFAAAAVSERQVPLRTTA